MTPRKPSELERLRRSDSLKSAFIARVSHELRTPLMVSMGVLDILKTKVSGDDAKLLGHARTALRDLSDSISDLLVFGDLLKADRPLQFRPADLAALIADSFAKRAPLYEDKKLKLETDLESIPKFPVDESILRAAFKQLAANAALYNTDGGRVRLRLAAEGAQAVIEIENDGRNFPVESSGKVFESFGQIAESMTEKGGRRGLGLAMVRLAAERHGGTLKVSSRDGGGAVVRLSLPIKPPAAKTARKGRSAPSGRRGCRKR